MEDFDLIPKQPDKPTYTGRPAKKRRNTQANGYAHMPGTGQEGETCGSCAYHVVKVCAKRYHKCGLMRNKWTGGTGTDIRVRSPACLKWEPKSV